MSDERAPTTPSGADGPTDRVGTRRSALIAVAVAVAAAVTISVVLTRDDPDPRRTREPPVRGLACPDLARAVAAMRRGDLEGARAAVVDAARVSQRVLGRSGERFGPPERLALRLITLIAGGDDLSSSRATASLRRIDETCAPFAASPTIVPSGASP